MRISIATLLFFACGVGILAFNPQNEIQISVKGTSTDEVIVYTEGATVKRTFEANLQEGETVITLTGVTPFAVSDSFLVKGHGKAQILEVRTEYVSSMDESDESAAEKKERESKLAVLRAQLDEANSNLALLKDAIAYFGKVMDRASQSAASAEPLVTRNPPTATTTTRGAPMNAHAHVIPPATTTASDQQDRTSFDLSTIREAHVGPFRPENAPQTPIDEKPSDDPSASGDGSDSTKGGSRGRSGGGPSSLFDFSYVSGLVEHYAKESKRLDTEKRAITQTIANLTAQIEALQPYHHHDDLLHTTRQRTSSSLRVQILVHSYQIQSVKFEVSYKVAGARWEPSYVLSADTQGPRVTAHLNYQAVVSQNTGEDWRNALVSLSTAKPHMSSEPPKKDPLVVRFWQRRPMYHRGSANSFVKMAAMDSAAPEFEAESASFAGSAPQPVMMTAPQAVSESGAIGHVFHIPKKSSISGDGKAYKLPITTVELAPTLHRLAVPSRSPHVHLTLSARNPSEHPIVPGRVSVIVDNQFVATSNIPFVGAHGVGEFEVSLGTDERLTFERTDRTFAERIGFIQIANRETREHVTAFRSSHQNEVELEVLEFLPTPSNDKLKVVLVEPHITHKGTPLSSQSAAEFFGDLPEGKTVIKSVNGAQVAIDKQQRFTFTLRVSPDRSHEHTFKYTVEWPDKQNIEFVHDKTEL